MKYKVVYLLACLFAFTACSNDDDVSESGPFSQAWFVEVYNLNFGGIFNFSESYVLLDFSLSETTVEVINYTSDFYLQTGTYPYEVVGNRVTIYNQSFDYSIENDVLILSVMPEVDGPVIRFVSKDNNCIDDPLDAITWLRELKETTYTIDCAGVTSFDQYSKNGICIYQVQICAASADTELSFYTSDGELFCDAIDSAEISACLGGALESYDKRVLLEI